MGPAGLDVSGYEEIRLNSIISQYRNVEVLHPVVARLCEVPAHRKIFHRALTHDLDIIHSRSPHLPDFEITIYQKALKILMERGEDKLGGIEIYVDEILGVKLSESADSLETLKIAVDARDLIRSEGDRQKRLLNMAADFNDPMRPESDIIEKRLSSSARERSDLSPSRDTKHRQQENSIHKVDSGTGITQDSALQRKNKATSTADIGANAASIDKNLGADPTPEIDPKMSRLWALYETGRAEYISCLKDGFSYTRAARFLRDAIENGLFYIERAYPSVTGNVDSKKFQDANLSAIRNKLMELRTSLKEITPVVEDAYGGQKRRFDSENDQPTAHASKDKQRASPHHLDRDVNTNRASEFHHGRQREPISRDSKAIPEIIRQSRRSKKRRRQRLSARLRIPSRSRSRSRARAPPSSRCPPCMRSPLPSPGGYDNRNPTSRGSWRGEPTIQSASFARGEDRYRPTY